MSATKPTLWKQVRIGDTLRLVNGAAFKPTDWTKDGVPIIRIQNLNNPKSAFNLTKRELPEKFKLRGGELLFAWSGTPGTSFGAHIWSGGEAWLNQHIFNVLFDENEWDKKFLQFAINQNLAEYIRAAHGGAGLAHITKGRFEKSELLQPTLNEQRRIVAEIERQFTRLEAGVAALRRVQANLKRYRAAVLKAACEGRLVENEVRIKKAEGRKVETGEQLIKRILTERRQNWQGRGKYKEPAAPDFANLPPLPEGWMWASLEQIARSSSYGTSAKCSPDNSGPPVLRIPNIASGRIDLTDLKFAGANESIDPGDELAPGDLLIIRTNGSKNLIGRSAVVREKLKRATSYASYLIRFRLFASSALFDWVGTIWDVSFLRAWIEQRAATSAGQHNISMSVLSTMPIPLPPLAEQTRIVAEVERRLSVVEELESVVTANLQRATRLRQSILQKAFTGELVKPMPVIDLAEIIPPLKPEHINRPNRHFARAILSAEIVHRLHGESTFGRIKHQKVFHLCEYIAQIEEIQGEYHREAAGPLDNKLIYANEAELKKQKWYQEIRRDSYGHAYQPLAKAGDHRKYLEGYWPDKLPLVEKLIELMRTWNTDRCEIFCTAYAAWNDLILWDKQATEDNILHEILERWHDSKKRFPKERWLKAIAWMKKEGFAPTGFGKPTKEAK